MTAITCWSCGASSEDPHFCRCCGTLQPPSGDYFEYLGVARKLQIDLGELERNFYSLSRRLHPDIYFRRSARERQLSEEAAARLNDGYRTLQDPVSRADYLLGLYGIERRAQSVPAELLEDVFELNTALERIRSGDDSALPQLVEARSRFKSLLEEADGSLQTAFSEWDQTGEHEALETISGLLHQRSYILKLLGEVTAAVV